MSTQPLSPAATRIAAFLSDFSPARRVLVARQFDVFKRISPDRQAALLPQMVPYLEQVSLFTTERAKNFPEDRDDLIDFIAATKTLLSFLRGDEKTEDIISAISASLSIGPASLDSLQGFLHLLESQRTILDSSKEREDLARTTLPSLSRTIFSVDLRVKVVDGAVKLHVPIVVAYFDTDIENEQIWFQMTREQLEKLQTDVARAAKKLTVLEEWAKARG